MNKNQPSRLIAMAALVVMLGTSVRLAAQDKAAPSIALNKAEDAGGSAIHFNGALGDCEFDG